MKKNGKGRTESNLLDGIAKANAVIAELARKDQVDTAAYGFMVRKAGEGSLALHRGLHPSEDNPRAANGSRDPRLPKARPGLSIGGALKKDMLDDIQTRHDDLVHLDRWWRSLGGRKPLAQDFRWDPVMLGVLSGQGIDLDDLVSRGPGEFTGGSAIRDYPGVTNVVAQDGLPLLGCIDGDVVRAIRIRYDTGITYSWSRTQPGHVELLVKDRPFPQTVMHGLIGAPFSTVVGHPSLAAAAVQSYAQIGSTISFKSSTRLVRL